jgi:hypothetical protein
MKKALTGLLPILLGNLSGSESGLIPVRETPQVSALLKGGRSAPRSCRAAKRKLLGLE